MQMIEKYQTVPVTKEAVQWNGQNFDEIKEFTHGNVSEYVDAVMKSTSIDDYKKRIMKEES